MCAWLQPVLWLMLIDVPSDYSPQRPFRPPKPLSEWIVGESYEAACRLSLVRVARYSLTGPTAFRDQFFLPRIVIVRGAVPVPPALFAPIVTFDAAAVLGIPLMRPVDVLSTSPDGSPVAL